METVRHGGGGQVVVKRVVLVSVFHAAGRITVMLKAGDFLAFANCSIAADNRSDGECLVTVELLCCTSRSACTHISKCERPLYRTSALVIKTT
jgi:hypothetical protein